MAQKFLRDPANLGVGYPVIGANSLTLYTADALYVNTSGFLTTATTSSKILGYSLDDTSMAADNQTNAMVCPKYCQAKMTEVEYPASTTTTQAMVGQYCVFSAVTPGSQVLNASTTSATVGQFLILGQFLDTDGTYYLRVRASYKQEDTYAYA